MGTVKCQTIVNLMEEIAPKKLAESWDNVGLLVGDGKQPVKKLMVCLDAPEWVVDEAIEDNVDMIVCHHPIIFSGLKRINTDTVLGRKLIKLISNNISVYCTHTNYDLAKGGLNDIFAKTLGFRNFEIIEPMHREKLFKIVVFVPETHEETVRNAMCTAGAGFIGKYSGCTFRTQGTGTFKPEESANPFIGQMGRLENVSEYRIETIVPEKILNKVIREMLKAHPYEEVAYDIYELKNEGTAAGLGRLGELEGGTTLGIYAQNIKKLLGVDTIKVAGDASRIIKKVAMVNGSGNSFVSAARFAGADVLVTGDMQYHEIIDAVEMGMCVIDAGHFATEKLMVKAVSQYLSTRFAELRYDVETVESKTNIDPAVCI